MVWIVHCGVIILFLALGVLFLQGKGAFLIAGYNTAPKAAKAKYDEKALCRFMGKLMFALAACWLPVALSELFDRIWLFYLGIALYLVVIFGGVIYANTGNRFRRP